jgi:hypothetical protein
MKYLLHLFCYALTLQKNELLPYCRKYAGLATVIRLTMATTCPDFSHIRQDKN